MNWDFLDSGVSMGCQGAMALEFWLAPRLAPLKCSHTTDG